MRKTCVLILASLALACGGDDGTDGDGGDTAADDGATGADDGATGADDDGATGDDDDGATGDDGVEDTAADDGMAGPPEITSVTWTQAEGCMPAVGSNVELVVEVTDPDNGPEELTVSGAVTGCTPIAITALETTLTCPQAADYPGSIEVTDPDGNSDSIDFTVPVCMDGSAP
jgi:hypothetical protein